MTPEQRNSLRTYIESDSGKAFLKHIADYEISLLAEAFNDKATVERQNQRVNKASGIYWVRTSMQDLIKPTKVDTRKQG